MKTKNPTVEGLKEAARVAVIAALGVVLEALINSSFNWRLTAVAAGVAALKGLDRWIHTNDNVPLRGLLPF